MPALLLKGEPPGAETWQVAHRRLGGWSGSRASLGGSAYLATSVSAHRRLSTYQAITVAHICGPLQRQSPGEGATNGMLQTDMSHHVQLSHD